MQVDVASDSVSFEGDIDVARNKLSALGYPEADSKEAKSLLKKAKSYMSCAVGRIK